MEDWENYFANLNEGRAHSQAMKMTVVTGCVMLNRHGENLCGLFPIAHIGRRAGSANGLATVGATAESRATAADRATAFDRGARGTRTPHQPSRGRRIVQGRRRDPRVRQQVDR